MSNQQQPSPAHAIPKTKSGFMRAFKDHPASVGESYAGHMLFAGRFAVRLFVASGAALIHAIIPAWFETTASRQVQALAEELNSRSHL